MQVFGRFLSQLPAYTGTIGRTTYPGNATFDPEQKLCFLHCRPNELTTIQEPRDDFIESPRHGRLELVGPYLRTILH